MANTSNTVATQVDVFSISDIVMSVYTFVVFGVVCQAFNIIGIVTNIINIFCFVKQGFQDSVNISLLGLAVSDLGSLTTMAWTCICFTISFVATDLSFDPDDLIYVTSAMPHFSFTRVSGCLTAVITMERCLCIMLPLQIKSIITPKRTTVVVVCVFIIFFFSGSPIYAVISLGMTFSPSRNRTILSIISTENREHVEKITFTINNFCIPFIVFVIIVVCTAILSVKLGRTIKWRQKNITGAQADRVSVRNQNTAKMVVMISTLFIVCFVPICVMMLMLGFIPEMAFKGKYVKLTLMAAGLGYVLESINSSMNIFIYINMSSKYREIIYKYLFGTIKIMSE